MSLFAFNWGFCKTILACLVAILNLSVKFIIKLSMPSLKIDYLNFLSSPVSLNTVKPFLLSKKFFCFLFCFQIP